MRKSSDISSTQNTSQLTHRKQWGNTDSKGAHIQINLVSDSKQTRNFTTLLYQERVKTDPEDPAECEKQNVGHQQLSPVIRYPSGIIASPKDEIDVTVMKTSKGKLIKGKQLG